MTNFYVRGERKLYLVSPDYGYRNRVNLFERQLTRYWLFWKRTTWVCVYTYEKRPMEDLFEWDALDSDVRKLCESVVRIYEERVKDSEQVAIKNLAAELDLDAALLQDPSLNHEEVRAINNRLTVA